MASKFSSSFGLIFQLGIIIFVFLSPISEADDVSRASTNALNSSSCNNPYRLVSFFIQLLEFLQPF